MSVTEKDGTGFNAALEGYTVCGKTGTAQKINETGRIRERQISFLLSSDLLLLKILK